MIHNRQHQEDLHIKPGKSEVTCVGQLLCKLLMLLERIQMKMVMMMMMKNHQKRTKGLQITLGRPRCAPSARVPGKKQTCCLKVINICQNSICFSSVHSDQLVHLRLEVLAAAEDLSDKEKIARHRSRHQLAHHLPGSRSDCG